MRVLGQTEHPHATVPFKCPHFTVPSNPTNDLDVITDKAARHLHEKKWRLNEVWRGGLTRPGRQLESKKGGE